MIGGLYESLTTRKGYVMNTYKTVSKAIPVMPETRLQDEKKGIVPKQHRAKLDLTDLYRIEHVYTAKASKATYHEKGY